MSLFTDQYLELISGVKVPIAILGAELDQFTPPELLKQFEEVLDAKSEVGKSNPCLFFFFFLVLVIHFYMLLYRVKPLPNFICLSCSNLMSRKLQEDKHVII